MSSSHVTLGIDQDFPVLRRSGCLSEAVLSFTPLSATKCRHRPLFFSFLCTGFQYALEWMLWDLSICWAFANKTEPRVCSASFRSPRGIDHDLQVSKDFFKWPSVYLKSYFVRNYNHLSFSFLKPVSLSFLKILCLFSFNPVSALYAGKANGTIIIHLCLGFAGSGLSTHPLQHLCKLSSAVAAFGGGQLVPLTPDPPLLLFFRSELRMTDKTCTKQTWMCRWRRAKGNCEPFFFSFLTTFQGHTEGKTSFRLFWGGNLSYRIDRKWFNNPLPATLFLSGSSPVPPSCVCLWCLLLSGSPPAEPEGYGPVSLDHCWGGDHTGEIGSKGWTWRWWRSAAPSTAGLGWWWLHWWWVWRHCWSQACQSCTSAKKRRRRGKQKHMVRRR